MLFFEVNEVSKIHAHIHARCQHINHLNSVCKCQYNLQSLLPSLTHRVAVSGSRCASVTSPASLTEICAVVLELLMTSEFSPVC